MAVEVTLKKWGNSVGLILPKEFVDKRHLKEDQKIAIEIVEVGDLRKIFGSGGKSKMSGQEFKDMVKEGWM